MQSPLLPYEIWHHIISYVEGVGIAYIMMYVNTVFNKASKNLLFNTRRKYPHITLGLYLLKYSETNDLSVLDKFGIYFARMWVSYYVACTNRLDILKYMFECGYPLISDIYTVAIQNRNMEILKYICENRCPRNEYIGINIARHGNLQMLKYMHNNGLELRSYEYNVLAERGDLEMLKYAHENKNLQNHWTCMYAALSCKAKVLQYVLENGCSWGNWSCKELLKFRYSAKCNDDYSDILQYAHDHGCPCDCLQ